MSRCPQTRACPRSASSPSSPSCTRVRPTSIRRPDPSHKPACCLDPGSCGPSTVSLPAPSFRYARPRPASSALSRPVGARLLPAPACAAPTGRRSVAGQAGPVATASSAAGDSRPPRPVILDGWSGLTGQAPGLPLLAVAPVVLGGWSRCCFPGRRGACSRSLRRSSWVGGRGVAFQGGGVPALGRCAGRPGWVVAVLLSRHPGCLRSTVAPITVIVIRGPAGPAAAHGHPPGGRAYPVGLHTGRCPRSGCRRDGGRTRKSPRARPPPLQGR
ncbi:hypothetical protein BJ964_004842 [Actinoplanes lobatus]|uniref:Uncharacterized protein n=1 Tax=Actinoplanes lobatus TaxID=113568 RepID=A0A7W7HHK6_9ACTN|nr:hypothetical protein [Actinoplanes lobatus]